MRYTEIERVETQRKRRKHIKREMKNSLRNKKTEEGMEKKNRNREV